MANYNLSSRSDMSRFMRDLEKTVRNMAAQQINNRTYDLSCPNCSSKLHVTPGHHVCPCCGKCIDFELDIHWK